MDKLHEYQGTSGRFEEWKNNLREKYANWKETHENESLVDIGINFAKNSTSKSGGNDSENDFSHIYRSVKIFYFHNNYDLYRLQHKENKYNIEYRYDSTSFILTFKRKSIP
jgi:hypothetical protein